MKQKSSNNTLRPKERLYKSHSVLPQYILHTNSNLNQLLHKHAAWKQQKETFIKLIPPNIAPYCHFAYTKDNTLTILVKSSAWATRLRFLAPELLNLLNKSPIFSNISFLNIKNTEPDNSYVQTTEKMLGDSASRKISYSHAVLLKQTAENIDYSPLKEALLRIAQQGLKKA